MASSNTSTDVETIPPNPHAADGARIASMDEYRAMYEESVSDPCAFWAKMGRQHLTWHKDFDAAFTGVRTPRSCGGAARARADLLRARRAVVR